MGSAFCAIFLLFTLCTSTHSQRRYHSYFPGRFTSRPTQSDHQQRESRPRPTQATQHSKTSQRPEHPQREPIPYPQYVPQIDLYGENFPWQSQPQKEYDQCVSIPELTSTQKSQFDDFKREVENQPIDQQKQYVYAYNEPIVRFDGMQKDAIIANYGYLFESTGGGGPGSVAAGGNVLAAGRKPAYGRGLADGTTILGGADKEYTSGSAKSSNSHGNSTEICPSIFGNETWYAAETTDDKLVGIIQFEPSWVQIFQEASCELDNPPNPFNAHGCECRKVDGHVYAVVFDPDTSPNVYVGKIKMTKECKCWCEY